MAFNDMTYKRKRRRTRQPSPRRVSAATAAAFANLGQVAAPVPFSARESTRGMLAALLDPDEAAMASSFANATPGQVDARRAEMLEEIKKDHPSVFGKYEGEDDLPELEPADAPPRGIPRSNTVVEDLSPGPFVTVHQPTRPPVFNPADYPMREYLAPDRHGFLNLYDENQVPGGVAAREDFPHGLPGDRVIFNSHGGFQLFRRVRQRGRGGRRGRLIYRPVPAPRGRPANRPVNPPVPCPALWGFARDVHGQRPVPANLANVLNPRRASAAVHRAAAAPRRMRHARSAAVVDPHPGVVVAPVPRRGRRGSDPVIIVNPNRGRRRAARGPKRRWYEGDVPCSRTRNPLGQFTGCNENLARGRPAWSFPSH